MARNSPFAIERLEHDAGVIREAANDVIIHLHEIAQAARGEIVQDGFQVPPSARRFR